VLFTDFVDTVSAELLLDSLQRIANRHAVLFVTLRDGLLEGLVNRPPERLADVAGAVIAHDFLHDRAVVFQRLQRSASSARHGARRPVSPSTLPDDRRRG
jgi:uncharacterized protein (DUF58 family)